MSETKRSRKVTLRIEGVDLDIHRRVVVLRAELDCTNAELLRTLVECYDRHAAQDGL